MRILLLVFALSALHSAEAAAEDCVILLHGLARSDKSMSKLAERIGEEGYAVVNYGYPSTDFEIEDLARTHVPLAIEACADSSRIDFVTHSLGGIILRQYLEDNHIARLHRVVMLGPPNRGSEVVDKLRGVPGFELVNGPAGLQLGTDTSSVPLSLGPADFEVGIIAGTRSINLILSQFLSNPDDGKVSVESTKLAGMSDHITVPVSHPFLMRRGKAIDQVIAFLKTGRFDRPDDEDAP